MPLYFRRRHLGHEQIHPTDAENAPEGGGMAFSRQQPSAEW